MNLDIVISPGYRAATAGRLCGDTTPEALGLPGYAAPQDGGGGGFLGRVRAPVADPDQTGLHQVDAVEEARHRVVRAGDVVVVGREMGVEGLLERGHVIGEQVGGRMGEEEEAAR